LREDFRGSNRGHLNDKTPMRVVRFQPDKLVFEIFRARTIIVEKQKCKLRPRKLLNLGTSKKQPRIVSSAEFERKTYRVAHHRRSRSNYIK